MIMPFHTFDSITLEFVKSCPRDYTFLNKKYVALYCPQVYVKNLCSVFIFFDNFSIIFRTIKILVWLEKYFKSAYIFHSTIMQMIEKLSTKIKTLHTFLTHIH